MVVSDSFGGAARRSGRRCAYGLVARDVRHVGAYVALLPPLGYRVATFLFVGGLQAALERPRGCAAGRVVVAS